VQPRAPLETAQLQQHFLPVAVAAAVLVVATLLFRQLVMESKVAVAVVVVRKIPWLPELVVVAVTDLCTLWSISDE
jgi:hypothetical protein